ncbi:MAG TPA: TM0106 family RecB-like putative nuclease, partial [Candidatus Angelobacter sp.]|nr:TM0106 family RecB-like putative nuclease [Candidatus Angelobacter sp.]
MIVFSQPWETMKLENSSIRLAATDLSNHLSCRHLTTIELAVTRGTKKAPLWKNPDAWVLQERGLEHEQSYVEHLREPGRSLVDLREIETDEHAIAETRAAMMRGADVIVQATMRDGRWFGRADVLRRVEKPSQLGSWSYEIDDCKLAQQTKAETILQLCLYAELLHAVQGSLPEFMYVVRPVEGFVPERYRVLDYAAYYRQVKSRLEEAIEARAGEQGTYPEPNSHCSVCRWWRECDARWRRDDHLSLVAGITTLQQKQLAAWETTTVEELAGLPLPLRSRPERGSPESYVKVREQARVQVASREQDVPVFELLPVEPERGLTQLPEPAPADIFFDIEADPFVGTSGLEYLFGVASLDAREEPLYESRWAVSASQEKAAFEWFVDLVMARWSANPGMHVYHFGAYEPSAVKRLMGRYASREDEVDRMLRSSLFVNLHAITKQAVRAGVEEYSLKSLEQLYSFKRDIDLRDARFAKRMVEHCLELGRTLDDMKSAQTLEGYNRDDCVSTLALREWLERQRNAVIGSGQDVPRPVAEDGSPPAKIDERQQRIAALFEALTRDIPVEPEQRSEEQKARWLMANLLDWHRREDKAEWWEYFRLRDLPDEDLLYEKSAIGGLQWMQRTSMERKIPVDRYSFVPQETDVRRGELHYRKEKIGTVEAVNLFDRTLDIRKMRKTADIHPVSVFAFERPIDSKAQQESLFRLGTWVQENGVDAPGPYRAARDLLLRKRPQVSGDGGGTLVRQGESTLDAARRIVLSMYSSVLAVQGPPGSGKTYTGARMICELVRQGKKIGITALSHKVIRNLLEQVVSAAEQMNLRQLRCVQKVGTKSDTSPPSISEVEDNPEVLQALQAEGVQVAAGTSFLWSRQEFFEAVDV